MADELTNRKRLKERLLADLIRNEEPIGPPTNLMDSIMGRIGQLPAHQPAKPYRPPLWLKIGIPAILAACLVVSLIAERKSFELIENKGNTATVNDFSKSLSSWINDLVSSIRIPDITLPDTLIFILSASIILFWAFALLNHYLSKHLSP
ncbi:MAG: hypothetical protein R6V75_06020 [Bacteroidales bacterium]